MKRSVALALLFGALSLSSSASAAEPDSKERARAAYDRGLEAHKQGDMHKAAEEFALADSLAPSPVALKAALEAAIEADDPVIGAELLERTKREPMPASLGPRIKEAHKRFRGRAGRIRVGCPTGSSCVAKVDGTSVEIDKVAWMPTGQRNVVVTVDGQMQMKAVEVTSDQVAEYTPEKAAAIEKPKAEPSANAETKSTPGFRFKSLPPIYFYVGAGVTLVLAGVTTYFGFDTTSKHGQFVDVGCERAWKSACPGLKSDGESAQSRTNVTLALTLVSAAATTVLGTLFTDWQAPIVGVLPGGGVVGYSATF